MTNQGRPFDPDDAGRDRIDDRWTSQKLADAGYTFQNERKCELCRTELAVYLREGPKPGQRRFLFLDSVTLEGHRC